MGKDKIEILIKKLKISPLLYLSSFSRELFHSSFWYWLSELNKLETIKLLGGRVTSDQEITVQREYKSKNENITAKIDLTFLEKQAPVIVLENKIKDYPTSEQLIKITKSIKHSHNNIQYILTTLFPIAKSEIPENWKAVSYKEIANRLIPDKFVSYNDPSYHLIQYYKSFLTDLSCLSDVLCRTYAGGEYNFSIKGNEDFLFKQLNTIKFWEVYAKYRSSHFSNYIKDKLENNKDLRKDRISVIYSINHQKATVTIYFNFRNSENDPYFGAGIQIEDNQYRRFIGMDSRKEDDLNKWIKSNFWFKENNRNNRINKYKNTKDKNRVFSYQYDDLKNKFSMNLNDISYDRLYKTIIIDLFFIKNHRNKFKDLCRQ